MFKKLMLAAVAVVLVAGCAISQKVEPARLASRDICVVQNSKVRDTFRDAVAMNVREKGYNVKIAAEDATAADCPARIMYSANWTWDMAMYMRRAELIVFQGSGIAGRALYDATSGGGRMDKFISADAKVKELVDLLFPAAPAN